MAFDQTIAEQIQERVCAELSEGKTLREFCRETNLSRATINRWRTENPLFETAYARAVDCGSESIEDKTAEIEQQVLDGKLDPHAAYTVLRNMHWRTSVRTPRKYGQKVQLDADMRLQVIIEDPTRNARAVASIVKPALDQDVE